jgi:hypothetical protein
MLAMAAASVMALIALTAVNARLAVAQAPVSNQHQLVPAYFFPAGTDSTNPWHVMCRGMNVSGGPSTAIMNPSSGPGTAKNPPYTEAISYCHGKMQHVIGYVHTSYGFRALGDVIKDIDTYYSLYPVDGIFVDEMDNCDICLLPTGMSEKTYYGRIYTHVKQKSSGRGDVVGNPGSAASTAWQIDSPVADKLVVFEGTRASYADWSPPAWVMSRSASKFSHLVHASSGAYRPQVCDSSRSRNAGFVYVTDDVLPNPWDRLPTYWTTVAPRCLSA